jgi:hypothetical protein
MSDSKEVPSDVSGASCPSRCYVVASSGNVLERRESMFYWRGRYFPGLVDVETNALYDHPDDSFNAHVHIPTAIGIGLIRST